MTEAYDDENKDGWWNDQSWDGDQSQDGNDGCIAETADRGWDDSGWTDDGPKDDYGGHSVSSVLAILLPANNSAAAGVAFLTFDEDARTLKIDAAAKGLEPNQPHPFHIHGFIDDRPSERPTIDNDIDRDGFVETPEGRDTIGPILLPLTAVGGPSSQAPLNAYPVADANGNLNLSRTYYFDPGDPDQNFIYNELVDRFEGRGLQLHGDYVPEGEGVDTMFEVNGGGTYVSILPVGDSIAQSFPPGFDMAVLKDAGFGPGEITDLLLG